MDKDQFLQLVQLGREGRNLEFKRSAAWTDSEFKAKIIKSILAFSNVRDGGWIIIGVEQQDDGTFNLAGISPEHLATYTEDNIASSVAEFADPYVKIFLDKADVDGTLYLVIGIEEFDDIPVICKNNGAANLRKGAIYTRSNRMAETVAVPSQTEMREILDMAIERRLRKFLETLNRVGMPISLVSAISDDEKFESQLKDLR
jgi:predicted HTH transcriptional regulator